MADLSFPAAQLLLPTYHILAPLHCAFQDIESVVAVLTIAWQLVVF